MAGQRGVTLLDTIVGTALMLVIFMGIASAFKLSIDVVTSNKARGGAIALANERMEYIRSLPYTSVGTTGGIPSGSIPQSQTVSLNGVTYTRRTVVEYGDDPKDGSGASDANNIVEDYKTAKVDLAWTSRLGTRHITLVTRLEPPTGLESSVPGGTLALSVVNAASQPLSGASVSITNGSTVPAVNINTLTNTSGTVTILGAPAASGYQIIATQSGYSTAQTYSSTAQNTNPNPANLTVANNHTTSGTFAIDLLGTKTIRTWTQVLSATWSDSFSDASKIATSSNIALGGGLAKLSDLSAPGELQSIAISVADIARWKTLSLVDAKPAGTSIRYRLYGGTGASLIPDAQLPGNGVGFTAGPIDLTGISTSTYQSLRLDAVLTGAASSSPSIDSWSVNYDYGPDPLPNIAFTMRGAKTIGSGPGGTIYKYSQNLNSGASASLSVPNLEWDTYTLSVGGSYDIASSCNPQPEALAPGGSVTTNLYLTAHTTNSLLVDVRAAATGALIPGASITLSRTGFSATSTTDTCAQSFFGGLTASNTYKAVVSASGYTTKTQTSINVSGASRLSIALN